MKNPVDMVAVRKKLRGGKNKGLKNTISGKLNNPLKKR